jgi:two-component system LytT family response regulator
VAWLESAGNYVRLHTQAGDHLVRGTLQEMEQRLDPRAFVRVHRSVIVNLDHVRKLEPYFHGEYTIHLRDGTRLTSSRGYSARLRDLLR